MYLDLQVASDIQLYDRSQQSQFTTLNLQTGSLLGDVNNHTTELNILRSNLLLDQSRIRNVEKNVTVVHDALAQFRTQVVPQMNQLNGTILIKISYTDGVLLKSTLVVVMLS